MKVIIVILFRMAKIIKTHADFIPEKFQIPDSRFLKSIVLISFKTSNVLMGYFLSTNNNQVNRGEGRCTSFHFIGSLKFRMKMYCLSVVVIEGH